MIRKFFIVTGAVLLLAYLIWTRGLWLAELEEQAAIGRDRLSKPISLDKAGEIVWRISEEEWKYTGEVHIALVVDRDATIPSSALYKESMPLKVAMDVNAVAFNHAKNSKKEILRANRLIQNWYFTNNQPLSPDARIWQSGGSNSIEFGLCGATRYPYEDTIITMEILQPDPVLNKGEPRLVAFGEHDYAVYGHITFLKICRDAILSFLALCIVLLTYYALKAKPYQLKENGRDIDASR